MYVHNTSEEAPTSQPERRNGCACQSAALKEPPVGGPFQHLELWGPWRGVASGSRTKPTTTLGCHRRPGRVARPR